MKCGHGHESSTGPVDQPRGARHTTIAIPTNPASPAPQPIRPMPAILPTRSPSHIHTACPLVGASGQFCFSSPLQIMVTHWVCVRMWARSRVGRGMGKWWEMGLACLGRARIFFALAPHWGVHLDGVREASAWSQCESNSYPSSKVC